MLDINFIRENKDIVKMAVQKKHLNVDVEKLLSLDEKRRELQQKGDILRAKQKEMGARLNGLENTQRREMLAELKHLKQGIQIIDSEMNPVLEEWRLLMLQIPNIPDMSVPEGALDSENSEIRTWGTIPHFTFPIKNHIELLEGLEGADFSRGVKTAGFRGYYLMGETVEVWFALWNFVNEYFHKVGGYIPLLAPSLVRREPFIGTGYLPQSEDDLYKTQDGDFLAGTAEVSTMSYFMNEIIDEKELPKKFLAASPCFRREAGSHGKDTKGLIRVHEFFKMEQVVLCEANHQTSVEEHEKLILHSENIMQALSIPYRVVVNCGGDLGLGQVKKYDLEAWVPSENTYRETHSASYFHDFQTRRLNIRYRDKEGVLRFVHSLNNTALAAPRILVPLLENNQEEDGSVRIPEVLLPYMYGKKFLKRKEDKN
jgi:seryl-tRNA synthetase